MRKAIHRETGRCYIGTSGWSYSDWAGGRFYPKGLRQGGWLSFFAKQFSTVEVNMSFYRLPKTDMLERWHSMTGSGFVFALKLWRRITHEKRLADCSRELRDFFAVTEILGAKRGPLLVQLPPSMRTDLDRLDAFLTEVNAASPKFTWRVAVEFRNRDWRTEETCVLLDRHDAALCLSDMPRCPIGEPNNASFVYVRRHGPTGSYSGCYSDEQIAADAARVRTWLKRGRDVYIYFNNDIEGHAVDNARQLRERVEM